MRLPGWIRLPRLGGAGRPARPRKMLLEPLESRLLLSGDAQLLPVPALDPYVNNLAGQVVYVDHDGASGVTYDGPVRIEGIDVPAYQAPASLAGEAAAAVVPAALAELNTWFADLGVTFTDVRPGEDTAYSTIYLWGEDSALEDPEVYGLAEHVDVDNQDRRDEAFVFSEPLADRATSLEGYVAALAAAIAEQTGDLLGVELVDAPAIGPDLDGAGDDDWTIRPVDHVIVVALQDDAALEEAAFVQRILDTIWPAGLGTLTPDDVAFQFAYEESPDHFLALGTIDLPDGVEAATALDALAARPDVAWAEPDYILRVDLAATAVGERYTTNVDKTLLVRRQFGVLGNDEGATAAELVRTTTSGTLTLAADGSFTYRPNANFRGTDSFEYRATDGTSPSAPVQVTIEVMLPDDPEFFKQWHLRAPGDRTSNDFDPSRENGPGSMFVQNAWTALSGDPNQFGTPGKGVIVAVFDSGFDLDHPDLKGQFLAGRDFVDDKDLAPAFRDKTPGPDNDPRPVFPAVPPPSLRAQRNIDVFSHGTATSGVIAAIANNDVGVAGVAPQAKILPLRVLYMDAEFNEVMRTAALASAIDFAIQKNAQIFNFSLNIDGAAASAVSRTLRSAIDRAYAANKLIIVATGNDRRRVADEDIFFTQGLFVASTEVRDLKSGFSTYGPGTDISAPGTAIWTTVPDLPKTPTLEQTAPLDGTSFAAPNAAGVAALIWAKNPGWSRDRVAAQLVGTADASIYQIPGNARFKGELGSGRVDAHSAVTVTLTAPTLTRVDRDDQVLRIRSDQPLDPGLVNAAISPSQLATTFKLVRSANGISFDDATDVNIPLGLVNTVVTVAFTASRAGDQFTVLAHGLNTGDGPLRIEGGGSLPEGLSEDTDYWAIFVNDGTFQLAESESDAKANQSITLKSGGSGLIRFASPAPAPTPYRIGSNAIELEAKPPLTPGLYELRLLAPDRLKNPFAQAVKLNPLAPNLVQRFSVATGVGGAGDVIPVDVKKVFGGTQFAFVGTPPANVREPGLVEGNAKTFATTGLFYFLPEIVATGKGAPGFPIDVKVNGQDRKVVVQVDEGFELPIQFDERGGRTATKQNVWRLEQRLRFLGFTDKNGAPLVVDGNLTTDERWALGTFNAAARGLTHDPAPQHIEQQITWNNGPRWVQLTASPPKLVFEPGITDTFATSWAAEVLEGARLRLATNGGPALKLRKANTQRGDGDLAGLILELTAPFPFTTDQPFFKTLTVNGVRYIAAATSADATASQHVIRRIGQAGATARGRVAPAVGGVEVILTLSDNPALTGVAENAQDASFIWLKTGDKATVLRIDRVDDAAHTVTVKVSESAAAPLIDGPLEYAIYDATPTSGSLTNALRYDPATSLGNEEQLRGIAGFIVDNPANGYTLAEVRKQFTALLNADDGPSGAAAGTIFYNDPRTWDMDGTVGRNQEVKFKTGLTGHYEVEIGPPLDRARLNTQTRAVIQSAASAVGSALEKVGSLEQANQNIPLVGQTLAETSQFRQTLSQDFLQPVTEYLASDEATDQGLAEALSTGSVIDGVSSAFRTAPGLMLWDIVLTDRSSKSIPLDLGSAPAAFGFSLDPTFVVEFAVVFVAEFTLGLDLAPGLALEDAAFIQIHELSLTGSVELSDVNFGLQLGPLDLGVKDGRFLLNLKLRLDTSGADKNHDGRLSVRELQTASLGELLDVDVTSALDVELPVVLRLGHLDLSAVGTPKIVITDDDLLSGPAPKVEALGFDQLVDPDNLPAIAVLVLFDQLRDWLTTLGDSSLLDVRLPLTGKTLASVLNGPADPLVITGPTVQEISDVTETETIKEFTVKVTNLDPRRRDLVEGDPVHYTSGGVEVTGEIARRDATSFTVRYSSDLDQAPDRTSPAFRIVRPGSLSHQLAAFMDRLDEQLKLRGHIPSVPELLEDIAIAAGVPVAQIGNNENGTGDERVLVLDVPFAPDPLTFSQKVDLSASVPGLALSADAVAALRVAPSFRLPIGVRLGPGIPLAQRFFAAENAQPEVTLAVSLLLDDPSITGKIQDVFAVKLREDPAVTPNQGVNLTATLAINLVDPTTTGEGADGRISLDELSLTSLSDVVQADISGSLDIDGLTLAADVGGVGLGGLQISIDGATAGHIDTLDDLTGVLSKLTVDGESRVAAGPPDSRLRSRRDPPGPPHHRRLGGPARRHRAVHAGPAARPHLPRRGARPAGPAAQRASTSRSRPTSPTTRRRR